MRGDNISATMAGRFSRAISDLPGGRQYYHRSQIVRRGRRFSIGAPACSPTAPGLQGTVRSCLLPVSRRPYCAIKTRHHLANGDPSGFSRNTVAGADFQFLGRTLRPAVGTDVFYQRSFSTQGDDDALGLTLNYPNEPWGGDFHFKQLGENYFPRSASSTAPASRAMTAISSAGTAMAGFRFVELLTRWNIITALNNHIESRENILEGGSVPRSPTNSLSRHQ